MIIRVGSDSLIEWNGLQDPATGEYVNTATVTFTLKTSTNAVVAGADSLPMSARGTGGNYFGALPSALGLTRGWRYYLEKRAAWGENVKFRRIPVIAA